MVNLVKVILRNYQSIGYQIKEKLEGITELENYVLSLQLDYRENNTLFYLEKINEIIFEKDMLIINQKNNTTVYLFYDFILEYCIIKSEDIIDLGVA